jgi:shikimate dehydrogenase
VLIEKGLFMIINGKTKITGLFGYPVEHTLSPAMHNAAYEHLNQNICYLPFEVHPVFLEPAVDSIRALKMLGANITLPHKESVIPLLDTMNEEAAFIGAVNTVVNKDGSLIGYNTDGKGFMRSLSGNNINVKKKNILVVGAGGASRAISYHLSEKANMLYLFDIDKNKLEKLVSDLSSLRTTVSGLKHIKDINQFEIIINATPLGLKQGDPFPFDVEKLTVNHTVIDLIYRTTPLLEYASRKGCQTTNGLGMLLWQGAFAFELWTNVSPPVDIMRNALLNALS